MAHRLAVPRPVLLLHPGWLHPDLLVLLGASPGLAVLLARAQAAVGGLPAHVGVSVRLLACPACLVSCTRCPGTLHSPLPAMLPAACLRAGHARALLSRQRLLRTRLTCEPVSLVQT